MASSSSPQKIILISNDGESFEVDKAVALESQTIKHLIDDGSDHDKFPLHNVNSKILAKVIEYCKKHVEASKYEASTSKGQSSSAAKTNDELKTWDAEFIDVDKTILFDLMLAANYLNIKGLLDLSCKTVADLMKGKTPEQIRETFNIKNDYTPDEEEEVRRENFWAFR